MLRATCSRDADPATLGKDPKTRLQEWLQARRLPVPEYVVIATAGEAHAQPFTVECRIPALAHRRRRGRGASRRAAEQAAAAAAWRAGDAPSAARRGMSAAKRRRDVPLRPRRDRRPAERRQVDAAQRARRRRRSASRRRSRRRRAIGSSASRPSADAQFVFVDTPGFQTRHRSRLNERLNRTVRESLADVDVVVLVRRRRRGSTDGRPRRRRAAAAGRAGDRRASTRSTCWPTRRALLPRMAEIAQLRRVRGDRAGLGGAGHAAARRSRRRSRKLLPESPRAVSAPTSSPIATSASSPPSSSARRSSGCWARRCRTRPTVGIDQFEHDGALRRIHATVYVDKASQRAILLGEGGARMKAIATQARARHGAAVRRPGVPRGLGAREAAAGPTTTRR